MDTVQMASNYQFILAYTLHQRPGDTRCLIPHLQKVKAKFNIHPKRIIADAGYGSEENYAYLEEKKQEAYIKYGLFEKEQKKSFKKNPHHQSNWSYDEKKDTFTCAAGKFFISPGRRNKQRNRGMNPRSEFTSVTNARVVHFEKIAQPQSMEEVRR
jgi:Transposase DDE domain